MATVLNQLTAKDYLEIEVQSPCRHEYRQGEMIAMTGGTPNHNRLNSALNALLWYQLRQKPYSVFVTDQRLWIPDRNIYTYPDVMVLPKPIELQEGRRDTVINPIVIAEVLSPAIKDYDRSEKFAHYRTIQTLQDYLLIDPDRTQIEHFSKRSQNEWLYTEYAASTDRLQLQSLGVELNLWELYEEVEL